MDESQQSLGGRLPLLHPDALKPEQKALYDRIVSQAIPWAESAGFAAKQPDGTLLGPFNCILLSPKIAGSFLDLQAAEGKGTVLSNRVRQVVILTVGAVWNSDYERYAHSAVAKKAGLPEEAIQALCKGEPAISLTQEEQVAQRLTRQITGRHKVDDQLYADAVAAFGTEGIVDLLILAGCYDTVSSLLNTFQVPVPE